MIIFDPEPYNESGTCNAEVSTTSPSPYDLSQDGIYASGGNRWFFRCSGGPTGKYIETQTVQNQVSAFNCCERFAAQSVSIGQVWYLAYFHRVDRINGLDVWHTTDDSGDKGVEINGTGLRWLISMGSWGPIARPGPGHFIMWAGNPTYHLNRSLEINDIYSHNVAPYSNSNPFTFNYERWYALVLELKVATDNTGWVKLYANGTKFVEYLDIATWANVGGINISRSEYGGTIAQPAYDAPPHIRKIDRWIVTDEPTTLQARGYFSDPSATGTQPTAPTNLQVF